MVLSSLFLFMDFHIIQVVHGDDAREKVIYFLETSSSTFKPFHGVYEQKYSQCLEVFPWCNAKLQGFEKPKHYRSYIRTIVLPFADSEVFVILCGVKSPSCLARTSLWSGTGPLMRCLLSSEPQLKGRSPTFLIPM